MNWYSNACPICRGTLHDDLEDKGWLTCFSCARSFNKADLSPDSVLFLLVSKERKQIGTLSTATSEGRARSA